MPDSRLQRNDTVYYVGPRKEYRLQAARIAYAGSTYANLEFYNMYSSLGFPRSLTMVPYGDLVDRAEMERIKQVEATTDLAVSFASTIIGAIARYAGDKVRARKGRDASAD